MPIYSFDCVECKHETEIFCGIESRPDVIECEECNAQAIWRSINWQPPPQPKNQHVVYGVGKSADEYLKKERLVQYKCDKCGHGNFEWFAGTPPKKIDCELEKCSGECSRVYKVKLDMHWARFPYYDRGLGVILKSEQHRQEICRQRGLTPVDGDWDLAGEISKNEAKVEEEKETYRDYYDRVHNDPAYKDFRKAQDQGQIDQLLPPD